MKKWIIGIAIIISSLAQAELITLNPGDAPRVMNQGDVVFCQGAIQPPKPQYFQCTLWYQGSPGRATGQASIDLCQAIRSSVRACRQQMGAGTSESVLQQFCVANSGWYGMGARCIDQDGKSVSKPAICPGLY